jgi:cytochrome c oxidase subunit IV
MAQAVVPKKTYLLAYLVLLALTLLTTLLAYINMGPFSIAIAILIAAVQASVIVSFFMQALYESALVRVVTAGGIVWFLIMLTLVLTDYITRGWLPFPGK